MVFLQIIKETFLKAFAHVKIFKFPFFLVWDPHSFDIKGRHYYELRDLIQPGDIVLRAYRNYLDGYFIPGKYSHASLYVGEEKDTGIEQIIHAMTPNVQWIDLASFMRCDRICVIRPEVSLEDKQTAIARAKAMLGRPYDYDFEFELDGDIDADPERKFSCSELVYFAYDKNIAELKWSVKKKNYLFFTKSIFAPIDCLPIADSKSSIIYEP